MPNPGLSSNGSLGGAEASVDNGTLGGSQVAVPDDGVLLDRWRERRDGDAFAELCRRHGPVVFDLTCRVLGDRAGAEDVLQDAFLDLALEPSRRPADVGVVAWLARFALCRAKNRRASERARARRQTAVGRERPEDVMPEDRLERTEELERALRGCDPEDRALLAMRFLHEWDYAKIASALSISEGAARVRVHRALDHVRGRVGAADAAGPAADRGADRIRAALAAAPVLPLASGRLDASIRTVVDLAKVKLGAPPNGVEQATAASRGLRAALTCGTAAFLLALSAGVAALDRGDPRDAGGAELADALATLDAASRTAVARAFALRPVAAGPATAALHGGPRPGDWDQDVLGRPLGPAPRRGPVRAAAPAPEPPAPAAAQPPGAAGADAPADGADANRDLEGALRPLVRDARAAKGRTASSDDDRAGALPGSLLGVRDAADETAPDPADAGDRAAPEAPVPAKAAAPAAERRSSAAVRRRPVAPLVPLDALPDGQRALVSEAESLLRSFLATQGKDPAGLATDPSSIREHVRGVRTDFGRLRKSLDDGRAAAGRVRGKAALVNRMVRLLAKSVLADGGAPSGSGILWPAGAEASRALAEVVRVLSAGPILPAGAVLPDGAVPGDPGAAAPAEPQ